jgi:ADP-heptose:LPS heptosyltransferase
MANLKTISSLHLVESSNTNKPKTATVVRGGAYGDLIQASSVFAGLVKQGYQVTLVSSMPALTVVENDPNITVLVGMSKEDMLREPTAEFWLPWKNDCDRFVYLNGCTEHLLLAWPDSPACWFSPDMRESVMSMNYVEMLHFAAGIPFKPQVRFFPTKEEEEWAEAMDRDISGGAPIIGIALKGGGVNKVWWGYDSIIKGITMQYPQAQIFLFGDESCESLASGWEDVPNVHNTTGLWPIRDTYAFAAHCGLLIGPETGVMNAACQLENYKIVLLSHSTPNNLTRDWRSTISIQVPYVECFGRGKNEAQACHIIHNDFRYCKQDAKTGCAQCMADIHPDQVWQWVVPVMEKLGATK